MGVVDARNHIRDATGWVDVATDDLRTYLEHPMHGQVLNWSDLEVQRRRLDEAIAEFDEVVKEGKEQGWPKPEPAATNS